MQILHCSKLIKLNLGTRFYSMLFVDIIEFDACFETLFILLYFIQYIVEASDLVKRKLYLWPTVINITRVRVAFL